MSLPMRYAVGGVALAIVLNLLLRSFAKVGGIFATLLIAADPSAPDCVARAEDTAHLAAVTPHAEVLTVQGAGHLVHDELAHRDEFLRAVLMFLA